MVVAVASGMMHSNEARPREVNFVGSYRDGYIDGPGWRFLIGGTFLFGMMKRTTTFTTDNGAFVNQVGEIIIEHFLLGCISEHFFPLCSVLQLIFQQL